MEECSSSVAADFIEEAGSRRLRQSGWILPSVYFRCTESTTKASSCGEDSNETKWRHFFCEPAGMCRRPGSMWRSAPLGTKTSTTGSRKIRGQHWDIRGTRHVQRDSHSGALHLDSEPQSLAGKSKVGANVKSKRFAGRSKVGTGVLKGQR